ncbi:MAG: hypothetical protein JWN70_3089 [Planctomycetaceae bacterium]|nr:hypothetical protein [Planctomycetaceae bacterium]
MDFVLLGTGHETVPLIKALTQTAEHRLVAFLADDDLAGRVLAMVPAARRLGSAAEALNVRNLDAVIVDSSDAETLEIAKQLAANSVALLLPPRAAHGIEFIYQLGLIRDEQPDVFRLYPIRTWRLHPLVQRLQRSIRNGELGRIHQLQWEREEHVDGPVSQPALLSKSQVEGALLADVDLLKFLAGEFDQVTALQTGEPEQGIVQASLTLNGAESSPTQWSCRGTRGTSSWRLTLTGSAGQIALSGGEDRSTVTWSAGQTDAGSVGHETVPFDYGPAVLQEFLEGNATTAATSVWADDLNRIFDLLEGVHRSLRRKRTVELYFDTPSERSNFKTQMTAVGCGILLLTLLAIVGGLGVGIVAHQFELMYPTSRWPSIIMQVVRVLVFAPLFIFLFLQAGIFLSKPSAGTKPK